MTNKVTYASMIGLLILSTISCDKDFTEVGNTVIDNNKFETKELIFDIEITQENIGGVKTGNTEKKSLNSYLLGVYDGLPAKKIEAGFVSQLLLPTSLEVSNKALLAGEKLSTPHLDEVILKIPLTATLKGKTSTSYTNSEGKTVKVKVPEFKIDGILGNVNQDFSLNVYRNGTLLRNVQTLDVSKKRIYQSDETYEKVGSKLNSTTAINFKDVAKDTLFTFDRTYSNGSTYQSTLKVPNGSKTTANPFIVIKLDKTELKNLLFNKYGSVELASQNALNEYFRGVIVEVVSTANGAIVPLSLNSPTLKSSIDFIHTSTILDANNTPVLNAKGKIKTVESVDSFYLGGIKASTYKMTGTPLLPNNIIVQGTDGTKATVKILTKDSNNNGISDLEELRKNPILINDASLVFDVNSTYTTNLPKQLLLFKNEKNQQGNIIPTHFPDLIFDGPSVFDGQLKNVNDIPDNYSFTITRHVTEVIKGSTPNSNLTLRVFNFLDTPTKTNTSIDNFNSNPRATVLLSNSTVNGTTRGAKLKIVYTEEKQ